MIWRITFLAVLGAMPLLMADAQTVDSGMLLAQASAPSSTSRAPQTLPETLPANAPDRGPLATPASQLPSVEEMDQMFKQTPLGKAADEVRLHAEWRELTNRTVNDPDLVAARAQAEASRTDLEKRERLRAYYTILFGRMRARASSDELKAYLDARKTEQLNLLAQNRVRPGSTPGPTATPASKPGRARAGNVAAPEPSLPRP
ncbi:MAG: hypothetical protein JO354_08980 [Verrucomicrobia bacterium]|nr:hypothetical protein [Verrucomicrobiota bacterium]